MMAEEESLLLQPATVNAKAPAANNILIRDMVDLLTFVLPNRTESTKIPAIDA
jgi:hypothetical protein